MAAVDRFRTALGPVGDGLVVRELADSARTAPEAAAALGVEVGQIVKSLVFLADGDPVLALVGGDRRLDPERLRAHLGAREVRKASADEVREAAGFAIGGVPPFGHPRTLRTVLDGGLAVHEELWAAAGTPHAVFRTTPMELCEHSVAEIADIAAPD